MAGTKATDQHSNTCHHSAVACLTAAFTQQVGSNVGVTFRITRVMCLVDVK